MIAAVVLQVAAEGLTPRVNHLIGAMIGHRQLLVLLVVLLFVSAESRTLKGTCRFRCLRLWAASSSC
jgi:hypothetical protein